MNSYSSNGDSPMVSGLCEGAQETALERRKRMNMERMRRNRKNPTYRAEEQRRQRLRRKQSQGVNKTTTRRARSLDAKQSIIGETNAHTFPETAPWALAQVSPVQDMDARAAYPPLETAVVEIPTVDGCPVLPSVVTLSVFAPVPSHVTLVVVAGDAVRARPPCAAVPMIPPIAHLPSVEVRSTAHMGRNLNLDASGDYWYSNDVQQQSLDQNLPGAIVKREM